ncbi:hypothetical protein [Halanaerobacter jeridensis]|uniref:DNA repair exonuclease SbcCD ATPase subunit n=1 Tax=Halanaerobacter jeridensis TaxID=706427 RepID=A0A938XR92_9FIRM|nr:hypothetical protein [Halanaerobacter jeridensis]MBM7555918.1 DNA repair exonuclease SbcCD ATPase subunit [Halanaerobacter jeridensis]
METSTSDYELNYDLKSQINILETMIARTEEFYGFISDELPKIEAEIDDTIEETELLISYFTDAEEKDNEITEGFQILEVLETLESKINRVYDSLSAREDIFKVLESFVNDSDNETTDFGKILTLIDELRQTLKKLNNLSINAIIFSVKSDQEGAAFRVISDEINDLSSQIQEEYETIKDKIIKLKDWNDQFADELEQLIKTETRISNEYQVEIKKIFSEVLESLQTTSNILKDFMGHVQQAVEPVYDILVLVQNQDIIRQNLENLIEILTTLKDELNDINLKQMKPKEMLDRLVFIINTTQLSQRLMDNILQQLNESLFDIKNKFLEMKNDLLEIEEEGAHLTDFFAGTTQNENSKLTSVDLIYQELVEFVPGLIEQLDELEDKYQEIITANDQFYDNIEGLQTGFAEIDKIADRFKKVEVLAKIEFTRVSNQDDSFIKNIEEAIENFINSSQENQKLYFELKDKLIADYQEFVELAEANQTEIENSSEIISDSEEKLLLTKKMVKDAIQGLHGSVDNLISEILTVNQQLDEVQKLENKGDTVIQFLAELEEESMALKEKYLDKLGEEEWEENNQRLKSLEEKFTSYIERKTAQEEINDFEDIDTGSEGGELTLF